jgi:hypothetical protein
MQRRALGEFKELDERKEEKLVHIDMKRYILKSRYGCRIFRFMCGKVEEEINSKEK